MIAKIDSFRVVQASRGNTTPSIEIVLIHGFKSSRTSGQRTYLERWLEYATGERFGGRARATAFAFDVYEILSNGADELDAISGKLLRKIRELEDNRKGYRSGEDSKPAKYIFLAHGLGAWVIQNGLTRFESLEHPFATLGVIFLDTPDVNLDSFTYSQYLERLFKELSLKKSPEKIVMLGLENRLAKIHRKWRIIKDSQYEYVQQYRVWEIKSKIKMETERSTREKRRIFPGRLPRILKNSSQISNPPTTGGDELGRIFDEINEFTAAIYFPGRAALRDDFQPAKADSNNARRPDKSDQPEQQTESIFSDAFPLTSTSGAYRALGGEGGEGSFTPRDGQRWTCSRCTLLLSGESSYQPSQASSINDEMKVSGISTNALPLPVEDKGKLLKIASLAKMYLERGNLDNADILYQRCDSIMTELDMENTIQHAQIRMQMAITILQKGKYREATQTLEHLRNLLNPQPSKFASAELSRQIEHELEWWYALSLLREGRYLLAKQNVEKLVKRTEKAREHSIVLGTTFSREQHFLAMAKVRRLLALANGYLGDYEAAFDDIELVSESIDTLDLQESSQRNQASLIACRHNFEYTKSIILMLSGDYVEALQKATSALKGFEEQWGRKHFRSLEVASLKALLMAYNSDTGNATILCQNMLNTMIKTLGISHPLTLQTMGVLVYIFQAQSRFTEAVDTSRSLCKRVESSLGSDHPQTLCAKGQLAVASLSCGDYRTSEEILKAVTRGSQAMFGDEHPDTLRFQSELAQAYCYSWKLKNAEDLVLEVIFKQRHVYTIGKQERERRQNSMKEQSTEFMLNDLLSDVTQDNKTLRVHPDLLFSMQLLAKIKSKQPAPDLRIIQEIQRVVWQRRKDKLGQTHALSLLSEFELAVTFRDLGDLQKAQESFKCVARERTKLLGAQHPDTLAARHETLVMNFTLGKKMDMSELKLVLKLREWQLGRCHPDTLQSLLWIFALQLLQKNETEAYETADKLLSRLSQEAVRSQRLVETLQITEKVALFFAGQGHFGRSIAIFRDVLETIKSSDATRDKSLDLEPIKASATMNLAMVESNNATDPKCEVGARKVRTSA